MACAWHGPALALAPSRARGAWSVAPVAGRLLLLQHVHRDVGGPLRAPLAWCGAPRPSRSAPPPVGRTRMSAVPSTRLAGRRQAFSVYGKAPVSARTAPLQLCTLSGIYPTPYAWGLRRQCSWRWAACPSTSWAPAWTSRPRTWAPSRRARGGGKGGAGVADPRPAQLVGSPASAERPPFNRGVVHEVGVADHGPC